MSKDFKVTLKFDRLSKRYTVVQIVGNDVSITIVVQVSGVAVLSNRAKIVVRAGSVLNEAEASRLGKYAELTTK